MCGYSATLFIDGAHREVVQICTVRIFCALHFVQVALLLGALRTFQCPEEEDRTVPFLLHTSVSRRSRRRQPSVITSPHAWPSTGSASKPEEEDGTTPYPSFHLPSTSAQVSASMDTMQCLEVLIRIPVTTVPVDGLRVPNCDVAAAS